MHPNLSIAGRLAAMLNLETLHHLTSGFPHLELDPGWSSCIPEHQHTSFSADVFPCWGKKCAPNWGGIMQEWREKWPGRPARGLKMHCPGEGNGLGMVSSVEVAGVQGYAGKSVRVSADPEGMRPLLPELTEPSSNLCLPTRNGRTT